MRLYMPVEVFEETDAVRNHPEVFQRAGHHALIVTGRHSSRVNGSLQDVQDTLDSLGIQVTLFDSVRENPSVDSVLEAAKFGLTEGADFVIGIGGGSPMDAAKAVSLMMAHPAWDTSYLYQKNQDNSHLPLVLIPTTCGTGSEVTAVTILTRKSGDQWLKGSTPYRIFADAALVDGKYLASASMKVLRNTAVDALGHLWESALNRDASAYSRMLAEEGLRIWKKNKGLLLKKPEMLMSVEKVFVYDDRIYVVTQYQDNTGAIVRNVFRYKLNGTSRTNVMSTRKDGISIGDVTKTYIYYSEDQGNGTTYYYAYKQSTKKSARVKAANYKDTWGGGQ